MRDDRTTRILTSLALLHDDLDAIHSELAAIRSDLDKIAADAEYQAGVIRAVEGSVRALANRLREVLGYPSTTTVAAAAPSVTGEASSFPLTPKQAYDLATAIANAVTGTPVERKETAPVKPQPSGPRIRPPIEERIRQLRRAGFGGYDAALILMRERYPMQEIVRRLHVSPRKIAGLRKGEVRKHE